MTMLDEPAGEDQQNPFTIAVAEVTNNLDATGCARVQLQLPWLPDTQPWARVAVPGAGSNRGTYILPHIGDEVLVAFNRDDVSDCYVIGSLWSMADPPPLRGPADPTTKVAVKTQVGHEIELDDIKQTISITTSTGQKIAMSPTGITISTTGDTAKIELTQAGEISLSATTSISIDAPQVSVNGKGRIAMEAGTMSVNGGTACRIQAGTIHLN